MGQPKAGASTATADAPDLKALSERASTDAANAAKTAQVGTVVAGPFAVGEIGQVQVTERELGQNKTKYLYAEFIGQGKPQRIPLAAVSVLAKEIA